ncbi:MAG: ADP-forming succinate--CoA ligase subunit beta [Chromatiales bacterium]|nr:ADP-forming succinate--CoA ligase subunit beta [Gammaproteobacteria bacterium]MBW6477671.1 ADP-forming succinate--CoA ligase subunit beta [Chromatiales bacterium]
MNLHEYQAKALFAEYGIPVPPGQVACSVAEAEHAAQALGGGRWVVKAQVHAGGRGKAGGVKLVDSLDALQQEADRLLGSRLVTHQSSAIGQPINQLLIESTSSIARELYLAAVVDRASRRVVFMASPAGGMDIEEVAAKTPEQIHTVTVNPVVGLQAFQSRKLAFALGLEGNQIRELGQIMAGLYRLFIERDAALVEINPLIVNGEGKLLALDGKINLDENALYRQPELARLRDPSQEDEREYRAQQHGLNYVSLDGEIGCMVNGAGLAMATMDLIQHCGGTPANFLDVGGGTTADKVAEAFKLILSDTKVKAILVNIFGGIVRCDLIAEGIIAALKAVQTSIPVVVRLEGTNVALGRQMLADSGLAVQACDNLSEAAEQAVAAAGAR